MEPYIELLEKDVCDGEDVDIIVQSNNYRPLKLKKPSAEMLTVEELELVMLPVEQGVTLRLDFGDGRVFEQQISIEKNTPEYNRLHSGNFHGFRAHRQVTQDDSEVYNVDVRITSRPVAPNFESAKADGNAEPAHQAPVFENVSDEARPERPRVDNTLPKAEKRRDEEPKAASEPRQATYIDYDTDEETDEDMAAERRAWFKSSKMLWIGLAVVIAVVAGVIFLPQYIGGADDPAPAEEIAAQTEEPAPAPAVMTPEESADVEYLNSYPVRETAKPERNGQGAHSRHQRGRHRRCGRQ